MVFNTPSEQYKYLVMPFRFTNIPGIPVLRNMLNQFVFVYLEHVRQVLQSLLQYELLLWRSRNVNFIRLRDPSWGLLARQIAMYPKKVNAVLNLLVPMDQKQLHVLSTSIDVSPGTSARSLLCCMPSPHCVKVSWSSETESLLYTPVLVHLLAYCADAQPEASVYCRGWCLRSGG